MNSEEHMMKSGLEFVEKIRNGSKIELYTTKLSLENIRSSKGNNVYFREVFDGTELVISNIYDFSIIGTSAEKSEIVTAPSYATVINFETSNNISIENVSIGHSPKQGDCDGGVLNFSYCYNINLDNLVLYGCGTYGLELDSCAKVIISNTIIKECTYGILSILNCRNIAFENCIFENNISHDIYIRNVQGIYFNNCIFKNNSRDFFSSEYMINAEDAGYVFEFRNCEFDDIEKAIRPEDRDMIK